MLTSEPIIFHNAIFCQPFEIRVRRMEKLELLAWDKSIYRYFEHMHTSVQSKVHIGSFTNANNLNRIGRFEQRPFVEKLVVKNRYAHPQSAVTSLREVFT